MFKVTKQKPNYTTKCIRLPNNLVSNINKICKQNNITFTSFIIQACSYAINDINKK